MNATVTLGLAAAAALVAGGCASRAWSVEAKDFGVLPWAAYLPGHRAVERVTLSVRDRRFEFVGYRTCSPEGRDVRVQLLLESGISVLDVAVRGEQRERISGSAFEAIPGLAEIAMDDLAHVWGPSSLFARQGGVIGMGGSVSGAWYRVSDGVTTFPAISPRFGGYAAFTSIPSHGGGGILGVTLLGADLVPRATVEYADFDDDGVPREIHLVDLRDGHTLDVEVEEVTLTAVKPR